MALVNLNKHKLFTVSKDQELTAEVVYEALNLHIAKLRNNYIDNEDMYMSDHDILHDKPKESWKPDNRLVVNYAKYIVDTFGGYHIGIPLKVTHEDDNAEKFISDFRTLNDMEDTEYELAKDMDIFGSSFIYLYQDEDSDTRVAYESPVNMLMIHDDSIQERPLYAIRYEMLEDGIQAEVIDTERHYTYRSNHNMVGTLVEGDAHPYSELPVIEMIENEERQGIFDSVKSLINGLNKAVSEKANDVDYFADAYLKIIGPELEKEDVKTIRDDRIFNLYGDYPSADAAFLEKPNADTTQQNLIQLLKESIFSISMVANMNEENFGQASGTALAFKLQAMSNLAKMKDRKMQSGFNRMYRIVFSVGIGKVAPDDYRDIKYTFTRNVPKNEKEEAEIVTMLDGHVSDELKLSYLSSVDNVKDEINRIQEDEQRGSRLMQAIERQKRMTDDVINDVQEE
ncbi:phage portal protein [Suicoccus acidiformans]|uniref:Phage portal protein n=1 Tax=Suicoccus acidiformans TaxID=2036206 RepID=A0A347WIK9_9LACT|nr:phage portal protein [Suicoccus acidiformans]AXY24916.1 phage portal protein [Suicoccus acidiformans]